jgi:hypothetical protein
MVGGNNTKYNKTPNNLFNVVNLLKSCIRTRHNMLTNVGNKEDHPRENIISLWILECSCLATKCTCITKVSPYIMYIQCTSQEQSNPIIPSPKYSHPNNRIYIHTWQIYIPSHSNERDKNNPLIDAIKTQGWKSTHLLTSPLDFVDPYMQNTSYHLKSYT